MALWSHDYGSHFQSFQEGMEVGKDHPTPEEQEQAWDTYYAFKKEQQGKGKGNGES